MLRFFSFLMFLYAIFGYFVLALSSGEITTIGIGDGGNELGMGKVHDKIVESVPFGESIASSISCDYLITCGVSNWGGFAIASGLQVLSHCPIFQRFKHHGLEKSLDVKFEDLVLSKKQVQICKLKIRIKICDLFI